MRSILFWSCLPFVLPQALWVRRTAPRFAGAAGAKQGLIEGTSTVRLLGIGDSIIEGVGARTLDCALVGQTAGALSRALELGVAWHCVGRIGVTSTGIANELIPGLSREPADYVVLSTGVNDVTSLTTIAKWQAALHALLERLRRHSPAATIAVLGIPPLHAFPLLPQPLRTVLGARGRSFDRAARETVAGHPCAIHVPLHFTPDPEAFSADGFHPSESGYAGLGEAVALAMIGHTNRSGAGTERERR